MKNGWIASIIKEGIRIKRGDGAMLPELPIQETDLDEMSRLKKKWVAAMLISLQKSRKVLMECEEMKSRELALLTR